MLELVLPVPPTLNNWKTPAKNGRGMVKSKDFRDYTKTVQLKTFGVRPLTGPLIVVVRWFRLQKRGDLDGRLKALFDALNGIAWVDDAQISEIHAYRFEDTKRPRVELTISRQENAASLEALYVKPDIELEG